MMHFSKKGDGPWFVPARRCAPVVSSPAETRSLRSGIAVRMKGTDAELLTGVALSRAETYTDGFYP